jgi:Prolyl oligopeptidase family
MGMGWYEHAIRRYEHRRWTTDDNRMVRPFAWGLEHIDGDPLNDEPRAFLREYTRNAIEHSAEWFTGREVTDFELSRENVLRFTSPMESPCPENNAVHGQFFPARKQGPAVLVLPNWNAKWHGQIALCQWLQRIGISALKMSLPYHDRRMANGHERADQLVGPNIGLTLHANRQAVQDARACLTWLEQRGYTRLGILGTSIGSSVGYITLVHDKRVRAGGFFHVSTYFADVVSQGMTTNHVWEGLRHEVSVDELREYWAPISPMPYVERGMGAGRNTFMVYGKYDPTFLPELTEEMLSALRRNGAEPRTLELPVGHYSLELPPFSYVAGWRMFSYFLEALG